MSQVWDCVTKCQDLLDEIWVYLGEKKEAEIDINA